MSLPRRNEGFHSPEGKGLARGWRGGCSPPEFLDDMTWEADVAVVLTKVSVWPALIRGLLQPAPSSSDKGYIIVEPTEDFFDERQPGRI
jgi:hypothetical protein